MNEALKQKIVGVAVVTVVLAVVLPTLFDQPIQDELLNRANVAKPPADLAIENFEPLTRERTLDEAQRAIEAVRQEDGQVLPDEPAAPATVTTSTTETSNQPEAVIHKASAEPVSKAVGVAADKTSEAKQAPVEIKKLQETVGTLMDKVQGKSAAPVLNQPTPSATPQLAAAWSVQIGSFSDQANAMKARQSLLNAGEKAYLRASPPAQGKVIYRVYVGPVLKESDARALQSRLQATQGQKGMVVKYLPE